MFDEQEPSLLAAERAIQRALLEAFRPYGPSQQQDEILYTSKAADHHGVSRFSAACTCTLAGSRHLVQTVAARFNYTHMEL